jgi:hypothetical protein
MLAARWNVYLKATHLPFANIDYFIHNGFKELDYSLISKVESVLEQEDRTLLREFKFFILNGFRTTQVRTGMFFFEDLLLYPIKPGF